MLLNVKPPVLKAVLCLLLGACALMVVNAVHLALWSGRYLPLAISLALWLPLAWGLWALHPWARRVAVALLWLVVIVWPIGMINPFAAMDRVMDPQASMLTLLARVFAPVALAVFMLHILGKHKTAFGSR